MNNNYYIPLIEEFCIGFKYELCPINGNIRKWIEKVYYIDSDINLVSFYLEENRIRVKYLNKEQLNSMGFEYSYSDKDGRSFELYEKKIDNENLEDIRPWGKVKSINLKHYYNWGENIFAIEIRLKNDKFYTLFDGIINNESELKRILKMLGL